YFLIGGGPDKAECDHCTKRREDQTRPHEGVAGHRPCQTKEASDQAANYGADKGEDQITAGSSACVALLSYCPGCIKTGHHAYDHPAYDVKYHVWSAPVLQIAGEMGSGVQSLELVSTPRLLCTSSLL